MSESKAKSQATANRLRKQIAAAEAKLDIDKAKLAKIEAQLEGKPAPVTGLDKLWNIAPAMARKRSSKFDCRKAWNKIPVGERPTIAEVISAMELWCKDKEWRREDDTYVYGLDKWITKRQWENLPEITVVNPSARYSTPVRKPQQPADPSDEVTDPEEMRRLLGMNK